MVLGSLRLSRFGGGDVAACAKRANSALAAGVLCFLALNSGAAAQAPSTVVLKEPPPGYEPKRLRQGAFVLSPELRLSAVADSNVFATSANEDADVLYLIEPSLSLVRSTNRLLLTGDAFVGVRRYGENTQENLETYGVDARAVLRANRAESASLALSYRRSFDRRDDPESGNVLNRPPSLINIFAAEAGYAYRPGRLGLAARIAATNYNFLDALNEARDLTSYRTSGRVLLGVSSRVDVFVEPYAVWRDFRLSVDPSGVDRDGMTIGVNTGIALDVTDKLIGEVAVGYFSAKFDDAAIDEFSGVGVAGELTWRPTRRTDVVVSMFRGDVATTRFGASGRIDSRAGFLIRQELRRNLFVKVEARYRRGRFRAAVDQIEKDRIFGVAAERVLNRHVAISVGYEAKFRDATVALDEFEAHQVGVTLTARY